MPLPSELIQCERAVKLLDNEIYISRRNIGNGFICIGVSMALLGLRLTDSAMMFLFAGILIIIAASIALIVHMAKLREAEKTWYIVSDETIEDNDHPS